jgi:hypothetical protein
VKLASAVAAQQERFIARHVAYLRTTIRDGHSVLYTFDRDDGTSTRLEMLGPKGLRPAGGDLFIAPVPTVQLWSPTACQRPIAKAAANRDFPAGLDTVAARAAPLVGDELPVLLALLGALREETAAMRFRIPSVGEVVTSAGRPTTSAWMSALSLADIEAALLDAVA